MKKSWVKPELVILARANAEEMVLTNCKGGPGWEGDPNDYHASCKYNTGCPSECFAIGIT